MYSDLLGRIAVDIEGSGHCWEILEPNASQGNLTVLPLRFLGGIHRAVLEGRAPKLARYYPSMGGMANPEPLWREFLAVLRLGVALPAGVQTNEVTRCCALLPGFLALRRATDLPLRLLEIGASGGLNLRWDRYRYATASGVWGDPSSPVRFEVPIDSGPLPAMPEIASRKGCDLNPVDIREESGRLTLLSFTWPDQTDRLDLVRKAIDVAKAFPGVVEQADAIDWIERELTLPARGAATVVYHSILCPYLSEFQRARLTEILMDTGARATPDAPLAWLSMEPSGEGSGGKGESDVAIQLTIWPGGERTRVARSAFHGHGVRLG